MILGAKIQSKIKGTKGSQYGQNPSSAVWYSNLFDWAPPLQNKF